jgi:polyhydroxybutyrate depolymerase
VFVDRAGGAGGIAVLEGGAGAGGITALAGITAASAGGVGAGGITAEFAGGGAGAMTELDGGAGAGGITEPGGVSSAKAHPPHESETSTDAKTRYLFVSTAVKPPPVCLNQRLGIIPIYHQMCAWMKLRLIVALIIMINTMAAASAQSRQAQGKAYDLALPLTSSGVQRKFYLHVPPSYNRARAMPLVMVFHGLGLTGQSMIYISNLNEEADRKNFIVVYPDGLNHRWDTSGNEDVQFVLDMINKVASIINLDKRRIYAVGYSNGGHFVYRLACVTNCIAGIAIVAASMLQSSENNCSNSQRVPALFFIGTEDPLVPSTDSSHKEELGKLGAAVGLGGLESLSAPLARMGGLMTAEETVDFWVSHNQSSASPYTNQLPDTNPHDGTRVTRLTFGAYNNEVVYYRIEGGGHTWPGAFINGPKDIVGRTTDDIKASEIIADFFSRH